MRSFFLILFFTLISLTQAYAQQFYAGAIGGLVLSQIDEILTEAIINLPEAVGCM